MNRADKQYLDLLAHVLEHGIDRDDRTGTGTRSIFGHQMRFDLSEGFPLLTTKRVHFKSVVAELLWFLSGSTNVRDLQAMGCTIWDEWADENGELGPIYGAQWRLWWSAVDLSFDQISDVIAALKSDPCSRRHVVSAWNVAEIQYMRLAPCHCLFQFYVAKGKLSCQLYQRSGDLFLGVPFNIASYALLTHMIAREVGLDVGEFIHTLGDAHLYHNHFDQAREQLSREPRELPTVEIAEETPGIFEVTPDCIMLRGYDPHPPIFGEVSI